MFAVGMLDGYDPVAPTAGDNELKYSMHACVRALWRALHYHTIIVGVTSPGHGMFLVLFYFSLVCKGSAAVQASAVVDRESRVVPPFF